MDTKYWNGILNKVYINGYKVLKLDIKKVYINWYKVLKWDIK